jgi:hypothetical protein
MESDPVQQSQLMYLYSALGIRYSMLLPLTALVALGLTLVLVIKGRGPALSAALMLIVPLPLYVGLYAWIEGLHSGYQLVAMSAVTPKASMLLEVEAMAFVSAWIGAMLTIPAFLAAAIGSLVRALIEKPAGAETVQTPPYK